MTSIANDGNNNNDDSLRSTAVIENEEELLNLIKNKVSLKEKTIKEERDLLLIFQIMKD